ncbi:Fpg/Nei family DNA glycosylase [Actinoalloteichus fjordicus]|uniref:DNA-(apurinic or apyrimidinic site) lyase n=1 Tax=Actinoalloteichus fjordicus TaxID=1612552 RepID=A0AAC9LB59_9PSEU|nr:DNA-formamidopyrimidine glycosylase family protein [Actinoalloteichus fjordicus]APU13665.1 formamidopyrimidine-DNA glycosylase [Actinoalloteichus fjordicus]
MPEGHTLHRLARLHQRRFEGGPVAVSSPQGRFATEAARLDGVTLCEAQAYGKHLLHHYENGLTVHVHLGLYGTFVEHPLPVEEPVGQVRMRIVGADHVTDLRGPTACRILLAPEVAALQARLGPDPLRPDADPTAAWTRVSRSRASIAALLLDQSVLAGAGNVYRAEVLFRHGVPPMLPGSRLGRETWDAIWADLVLLMGEGVRSGRIDTVRPEHDPSVTGREPRRDRHGGEVYVYRRAGMPCLVCGETVLMRDLQGRKLYWCPACQAG